MRLRRAVPRRRVAGWAATGWRATAAMSVVLSCAKPDTREPPSPQPETGESRQLSVTSYGAFGDDGVDDTLPLQRALSEASGRELSFPPGKVFTIQRGLDATGLTSSVINGNGSTIRFAAHAPDIPNHGTHADSLLRFVNARDVVVRGLILDGNMGERVPNGTCAAILRQRCASDSDCPQSGACRPNHPESFNDCLTIVASSDIQIEHSTFKRCLTDGISITSRGDLGKSERIMIEHNRFVGNRRNNLSLVVYSKVKIVGNHFDRAGFDHEFMTPPGAAIGIESGRPGGSTFHAGVTLRENLITRSFGKNAVYISGKIPQHQIEISRNVVRMNEGVGIHFQPSRLVDKPNTNVVCLQNVVSQNKSVGIRFVEDAVTTITGNVISLNGGPGIAGPAANGVVVSRNIIKGNSGGGVSLGRSNAKATNALVKDNVFDSQPAPVVRVETVIESWSTDQPLIAPFAIEQGRILPLR